MKVLVGLKRVPDPYTRVHLSSDGDQSQIETGHIKHVINPFCEIALEQAITLREQGVADEVIVVSLGDEQVVETLRAGLAMGADQGIHITESRTLEPLMVARVLEKIVEQQQIDLVLLGKQSIDTDNGQVAPMLAGLLGWPQGNCIAALAMNEACQAAESVGGNDTKPVVKITEEADEGTVDLSLRLPAVISTDLRLNQPRFTSLPNIMKARSKPLNTLNITELGLDYHASQVIENYQSPPARQGGVKVDSVDALIAKIKAVQEAL